MLKLYPTRVPRSQVRLKCIVVGRHDVGKSSLVERFMHERFQPAIGPTVGAAFVAKDITVGSASLLGCARQLAE